MKKRVKNALIVVTIVGLLGVAVSASGCTTPIPTQMAATWTSTGVKSNPGGLTVSGYLYEAGTSPLKGLDGMTITLRATNDVKLQEENIRTLATTTTQNGGYFTFTISPSQDKYLLYGVYFDGDGNYQPQLSIVGGYLGLEWGITTLQHEIIKLPTSTFGTSAKSTLVNQLGTARWLVQAGQIGSAGTTLNVVLAKMDAANANPRAPAALVNADYTAFLLTKDVKWLTGTPWTWPDERQAPPNYSP